MSDPIQSKEEAAAVQRAFSRQAAHYDEDDLQNPVLIAWRKQVYDHINQFIKPRSQMLELNAGTGIDALHFVREGHSVHATDLAAGMIEKIQQKIDQSDLSGRFSLQQCAYEELDKVRQKKFDYVFSNFGGLNCCPNLTAVSRHLPGLLNEGAFITWVIMPPVSLWEIFSLLRGKRTAFRRLQKNGAIAHLEGEYFKTFYYSLSDLKKVLGRNFQLRKAEGLGSLTPPPSSLNFTRKYPGINFLLQKMDRAVRESFPFNRWADHLIATFEFCGNEDTR